MTSRLDRHARHAGACPRALPKPALIVGMLAYLLPPLAIALVAVGSSSIAGAEEVAPLEDMSAEEKKPVVDRALEWLVEHQLDDGGWSFDLNACPTCRGKCRHSGDVDRLPDRVGATAMALLPFFGRGYTHREGPYKKQIDRGVAFLTARAVAGEGKVYGQGESMHSQGLASFALAECYAMSEDDRLAKPVQLALDFIMSARDQRSGGWRPNPGDAADIATFGWQIMALRIGNMAYLDVDTTEVKKSGAFLDLVQADFGATYSSTDGVNPDPASSAVGLLCRMYLGWKRNHPAIQDGMARLAKSGPTDDLSCDYYTTLINDRGDWRMAWDTRMKELLLATQATAGHEAGSWYEGVNGGGTGHDGRLGCTALATTILIDLNHRRLPIWNESADDEFKE